jgi:hypothetical protein
MIIFPTFKIARNIVIRNFLQGGQVVLSTPEENGAHGIESRQEKDWWLLHEKDINPNSKKKNRQKLKNWYVL